MRKKYFSIASVVIFLFSVSGFAANDWHNAVRVGTQAEITLTQAVNIGGTLLEPGVYTIQHRTAGAAHFLHIQKSVLDPYILGNGYPQYTMVDVGNVQCQMKQAPGKITRTELTTATRGGSTSVVEVSIEGEDAVHVIQ